MSKKLVNSPENCVDECLSGLVAANPHLRLLEGHRVVVRADYEEVKSSGRVALLCGGGSGHEPAHGGYVGRGMLTGAVAGSVFASPPTVTVLTAIRTVTGAGGCLVIVKNYTGDRINFGLAVEQAKAQGLKVEMVVIGEDCALPSSSKTAGRRGLCGALLVQKVAGGLAEEGKTLKEVSDTAREVASSIGTLGVSLSSCSIPGRDYSFKLEVDEMEFGLGIHGEAGIKRSKLLSAREAIKWLIDHITSEEEGYSYFKLCKGEKVGLVLNNLGGTSNLEMGILAHEAIRYLVDYVKVEVLRVYSGALMTSLEMMGVSITLIKLDNQKWVELLDGPTTAVGWPNVQGGVTRSDYGCVPSPAIGDQRLERILQTETESGELLKTCVVRICEAIQQNKDRLNNLDKASGDGDCGTTLDSGATALLKYQDRVGWDHPKQALLDIARVVEDSMGGTSGALYCLFLTSASQLVGSGSMREWLAAGQTGLEAIMKCGGADIGDRTMIDALYPALESLKESVSENAAASVAMKKIIMVEFPETAVWLSGEEDKEQEKVIAAREGAQSTVEMEAKSGRASYVSKQHLTQPDPGAVAIEIIFSALGKQF